MMNDILVMVIVLLAFLAGLGVGLAAGLAIGRKGERRSRMPVKSWFVRHRKIAAVVQLSGFILNVGSATGFALLYLHDSRYETCVANYVQSAGEAQGPRAATSAAQADALHAWVKDIKPLLADPQGSGPLTDLKVDLDDYLRKYRAYAAAVKKNPTPPLPSCLGGDNG